MTAWSAITSTSGHGWRASVRSRETDATAVARADSGQIGAAGGASQIGGAAGAIGGGGADGAGRICDGASQFGGAAGTIGGGGADGAGRICDGAGQFGGAAGAIAGGAGQFGAAVGAGRTGDAAGRIAAGLRVRFISAAIPACWAASGSRLGCRSRGSPSWVRWFTSRGTSATRSGRGHLASRHICVPRHHHIAEARFAVHPACGAPLGPR